MHITVILGSLSDLPIAEKCTKLLDEFGVDYALHVASAHRTPELVNEIVGNGKSDVYIAIAGLAAALPGVVASHTLKPVIGVPVNVSMGGLDALLSMAQMPPGMPVATVGIGRGDNAALLAIEILANSSQELLNKLVGYREKMKDKVKKQNEELKK